MSRVGKTPITIPSGVTIVVNGREVSVSGPKGKLNYSTGTGVRVLVEGSKVVVSTSDETKQTKANFGTTRANINNMVLGVTQGWKRGLEMTGVGFNAKLAGQILVLSVGFSHEVKLPLPNGIKCVVTKNTIELEGADRNLVGEYAAKIRQVQPPEPYLGKGIKYANEVIRRKAGKTGKK